MNRRELLVSSAAAAAAAVLPKPVGAAVPVPPLPALPAAETVTLTDAPKDAESYLWTLGAFAIVFNAGTPQEHRVEGQWEIGGDGPKAAVAQSASR
jgi:hypothetical protein